MAFDKFEDYETTAIIVMGLGFAIWEKVSPAHEVDRRADWRRDVLALVVLVVGVGLSRLGLHALFDRLHLAGMFAGAFWMRWPVAAQMVVAMLLADAIIYWAHRLLHTRVLWPSHKWHHSSEQMWFLAGFRTSLLHGFIFAIPQVLIGFYLFRFTPSQLGVLFGVGIFFNYWAHANIHVNLGPLAWLIITPQYHRLHHSATDHKHGNFGVTFTLWDRAFGTFTDPRTQPRDYPLGLGEDASVARMTIGI